MGYAINIKPTVHKEGMTKAQFMQSLSDMEHRLTFINQRLSLHINQVVQNYYYDSANILNSINQKYS
ncbi:MAG TPA: hypothetical protein VIG73_14540 [Cerasibacillus sp.]|uniref:hypothetical protein n=1 Tax=Cerasibacillus sp. TaxID=2498711 RepID=UPI002F4023C3